MNRHPDPRADRLIRLFESLTPQDVARLDQFYLPEATFKDPFNEVRGDAEIQRIFAHMFVALDAPRFVIHDVIVQGEQCFMTWDFLFRMRRFNTAAQTVHGSSHLYFAADGRVQMHRDYWDAAEELYEKLPLLGSLMRWLKRRAGS